MTGKEQDRGFWRAGDILYLDLKGGYIKVFIL